MFQKKGKENNTDTGKNKLLASVISGALKVVLPKDMQGLSDQFGKAVGENGISWEAFLTIIKHFVKPLHTGLDKFAQEMTTDLDAAQANSNYDRNLSIIVMPDIKRLDMNIFLFEKNNEQKTQTQLKKTTLRTLLLNLAMTTIEAENGKHFGEIVKNGVKSWFYASNNTDDIGSPTTATITETNPIN